MACRLVRHISHPPSNKIASIPRVAFPLARPGEGIDEGIAEGDCASSIQIL
jgi:hypothetical protein